MQEEIIKKQLDNSKLYGESRKTQGSPAQLSNLNLSNRDLSKTYLREAQIVKSNLQNCDLSYADLSNANLSGSKLTHSCLYQTNLSNANLSNTCLNSCDLRQADLTGAIGLGSITDETINTLVQIANLVVINPQQLNMEQVHTCSTIHCAAGWVCTLNPLAKNLEPILGWNAAACLACPIPEFTKLFYASNEEMMDFLMSVYYDDGQSLKDKYLTN